MTPLLELPDWTIYRLEPETTPSMQVTATILLMAALVLTFLQAGQATTPFL